MTAPTFDFTTWPEGRGVLQSRGSVFQFIEVCPVCRLTAVKTYGRHSDHYIHRAVVRKREFSLREQPTYGIGNGLELLATEACEFGDGIARRLKV